MGLHRRIEFIPASSPRCGFDEESEYHAIVKCPFAVSRDAAGLIFVSDGAHFVNITDCFAGLINTKRRDDAEFTVMIAWMICFERNKVRVGKEPRLPVNVAANARSILNAFLETKEVRR